MDKQLKHVKFVRSKGKVYAYFNTGRKVAGKTVFVPMPPPDTAGFFESYASLRGHRERKTDAALTVAGLIDKYERSEEWKKLAKGSQQIYGLTLNRVRDQLGKLRVEKVGRAHVREVLNNRIVGNGARNIFLALVGILYTWAKDNEIVPDSVNPTGGIKPFPIGEHEPWPESLIEDALAAEEPRIRLAVHLLLYTGQRIGDVMKMRWSDIKDGQISVTQQKTGKELRFPLHSKLAAELERTPKRGITIITNWMGRQMRPDIIRKELKAFAAERGFSAVPHGLRKSAVHALLQAECSADMVMAITGQSRRMVDHYAKKIDQRRLGNAAILKWEQTAPVQTGDKTALQTRDGG